MPNFGKKYCKVFISFDFQKMSAKIIKITKKTSFFVKHLADLKCISRKNFDLYHNLVLGNN